MLSRVELCRAVCTHPSAVVTQFPILRPTRVDKFSTCSVFNSSTKIRCELVANSIQTADTTQLDWVASASEVCTGQGRREGGQGWHAPPPRKFPCWKNGGLVNALLQLLLAYMSSASWGLRLVTVGQLVYLMFRVSWEVAAFFCTPFVCTVAN